MGKKAKHEDKKDNKKFSIIVMLLEIFFIVLIIYSGLKIFDWLKDNNQTKKIMDNINDEIEVKVDNDSGLNKYSVNYKNLKEINPDTVAWIKVEGTNIQYPVVKAKDNDYYLNRSYNKELNGAGWVFADYRNKFDGQDKNIILYGHNRKDDSMFGTLKNILKDEWNSDYKNQFITFITENEYCTYQIFSAYRIEVEEYYLTTDFGNDEKFESFIKKIKSRSYKDFGVDVSSKDKILTLSTCSNSNYRVVVHAKNIDEN